MIQEEKAKRYDEAIERAKEWYSDAQISIGFKANLEKLFPELKENKDEEIGKAIIEFFELQDDNTTFSFIPKKDILTWLEKQGKQTFLEGDWVVFNNQSGKGSIYQVKDIHNYEYTLQHILGGSMPMPFSSENMLRLWTIQDAKEDDVLYAKGFHGHCIFIFDKIDNWKFDEPDGDRAVATGHCCLTISADRTEFGIQGPDCVEVNRVKPATKEQRDLLFAKMKEAGYEWDADKKELRKEGGNEKDNK